VAPWSCATTTRMCVPSSCQVQQQRSSGMKRCCHEQRCWTWRLPPSLCQALGSSLPWWKNGSGTKSSWLPLIWALVRRKAFNKGTSTRLIKQKKKCIYRKWTWWRKIYLLWDWRRNVLLISACQHLVVDERVG
jgi:hypothetical protein